MKRPSSGAGIHSDTNGKSVLNMTKQGSIQAFSTAIDHGGKHGPSRRKSRIARGAP